MAGHVSLSVERRFSQPIARVFRRYTDHEGWSEWAGLGKVRLTQEGEGGERYGVGSVRAFQLTPGLREQVVRFEPPPEGARPGSTAVMEYRVIAGPVPMADHLGRVRFESTEQGTTVTWSVEFRPTIPGVGALLRAGLVKLFERVLARLDRDLSARP